MVATVGSIEVTLKLLGAEKYAADFGRSAAATEQGANRIGKATASAGKSSESLGHALASLGNSGGALRSLTLEALRAETSIKGLTSGFTALNVAVAGLGGGLALTAVQRYADAYTNIQNKIAAVVESSKDRVGIENELFGIAQRSRTDLNSTVTLYQRLNLAAANLGATQQDIFKVVETTQKAFVVGGSTVAEAASTATQLAQALGSGKLSGDEFRAISENAPVLFRAIAKEFGVGTGELKQMASDGELTAKRVFKAIIAANAEVEEAFARTTPTIAAGIQQIDNALTRYIGQADKSLGASKNIADGLKYVADNIRLIGDAALFLIAILATGAITRSLGGIISGVRAPFTAASRAATEGVTEARAAQEAALAERNAASRAHMEAMAAERERRAGSVTEQAGPELEKRRQAQLASLEKLNKDAAKLTEQRTKLVQQLGSVEQSTAGASVAANNRLEASKAKLVATEAKLVDLVKKQSELDAAAASAGGGVLRSQQQAYYNSLARTVDARNAVTALNAEIAQARANIEQLRAARGTAMNTGTLREQQQLSSALFAEQRKLQELEKQRFATGRELNDALKQNASDESKIIKTQTNERERAAINQAKNLDQISRAEASAASQRESIVQQESASQNRQINQAQANAQKRMQIEQQVVQNAVNQRQLAEKVAQGKAGLSETARQAPVIAAVNQALENEKLNVSNERVTASTNALGAAQVATAARMSQLTTASRLASGAGQLLSGAFTGLIAGLGGPLPAAIFAAVAGWTAYEIVSAHTAQTIKEQQEALDRLTESLKAAQDQASRGEILSAFERLKKAADLADAEKRVASFQTQVLGLFAEMDKPRPTGGGLEEQALAIGVASEEAAKKVNANLPDMAKKFATLDITSKEGKENAIKFRDALIDLGNANPSFAGATAKIAGIINQILQGIGVTEQWNKLLAQGASERSVSARIGVAEPSITRTEADIQITEDKRRALIKQRFDLEHSADNAIETDYEESQKRRLAGEEQLQTALKRSRVPKEDTYQRALIDRGEQFKKYGTQSQIEELARRDAEDKAKKARAPKKSQEEKDAATLAKKLKELDEEARSSGLSALDEKVVKFAQSAKVATSDINQFIEAVTNKDLTKVPATMQAIKDGLEKIDAAKFGRKALEDFFPAQKLADDLHKLDIAAIESKEVAAHLGELKFAETAKDASEFSKSAASAIGDFALSAITDFKNVGTALEGLAKALEKAILQATIIKPLEQAISAGLGQTFGGGGSFFGEIFGSIGSRGLAATPQIDPLTRLAYHKGGLVGIDGQPHGYVNPAAFAGAPRFHMGFTAKEFPAILAYGERVLTAKQQSRTMSTMNGLASQQATIVQPKINIINNNNSQITTRTSQGSGGPSLDVMIDQIVADKLSTPGSASNRATRTFLGARQQLVSR